ncbi:MAG: Holliday junction branch migration protein RuvA [Anaerolineae bacterium]|nr:Holliday junction branch migration protein RuvA [Anaerolineae bacterium]
MLASLKGVLAEKRAGWVVVEVGGLGFRVFVPSSSLPLLGEVGSPVELHTHLHVRENELSLYGFLTQGELALFQALLGVSGIGPKAALALLSHLSAEELSRAIAQEQVHVLAGVPGVGTKTAQKVILELRDRMARAAGVEAVSPELARADAEALAALTSLGYSVVEAQRALQAVPPDVLDVAERIRLALQQLAT